MMATSKKRKLNGDDVQKYYAVRAGKTPGVYRTWAECQANTTGYKGASYKSFTTEAEARDFVAGKPVVSKTASGQPDKFYGVAVGHNPGVYTSWDVAQAQVTDIKGPIYRKFETRAEAEEFVRTKGQNLKGDKAKAAGKGTTSSQASNGMGEPASKKAKTATRGKSKMLQVWTDGSSLGNGKIGAKAGVGVFFGDYDERNVSEPLIGPRQTNQRAELTGILRALQSVSKGQSLEIRTDSNYSINCCTVWVNGWISRGWKTSTGAEVENRDLVERIKGLLEEREAVGAQTIMTWIRGHDGDPGNEAADRLAVAGAMMGR